MVVTNSEDEKFWYLVGALGDGTIYVTRDGHYVVEYGQKCKQWLETLARLAEGLGYKMHIIRHEGEYWKGKIYSKELYERLKEVRSYIHEIVNTLPNAQFRAFVRGLFDAEGTITTHYKSSLRVRIAQKDKELLGVIAKKLRNIGINCTDPFPSDRYGTYVIQIPHSSVSEFFEKIGTYHPLKKAKFESLSQRRSLGFSL